MKPYNTTDLDDLLKTIRAGLKYPMWDVEETDAGYTILIDCGSKAKVFSSSALAASIMRNQDFTDISKGTGAVIVNETKYRYDYIDDPNIGRYHHPKQYAYQQIKIDVADITY